MPFTTTVGHFDVALKCIRRVVEVKDAVVERLNHIVAEGLNKIGIDDGDEVVATHVANERLRITTRGSDIGQRGRGVLDDGIPAHEPVVIIESLEVVQVAVDHGDGCVGLDALLEFGCDPEVPR